MDQHPLYNYILLKDLFFHNASLGLYRFFKGIDYLRGMELPVFADELLGSRKQPLNYLDVGSGDSVFPSFIANCSNFFVTVIDKFHWVQKQKQYLKRLEKQGWLVNGRFNILEQDFLKADLPDASFDVITSISVLEHIEGEGDTEAVAKIYRLLKPGGRFLMSSPYNHDKPADYYMKGSVYGEDPRDGAAFFQRHYSSETLKKRIIDGAPFTVEKMFYTGHYHRFNFAKHLYVLPMPFKLLKIFYNWASPFYAPRFMQLSSVPPSDPKPEMVTMDTVFLFLKKPN